MKKCKSNLFTQEKRYKRFNEISTHQTLICSLHTVHKSYNSQHLDHTLDANQTKEQTGFRSNFLITDHIHEQNQVIEKTIENKKYLGMAITEYYIPFYLLEILIVIDSIIEYGVKKAYC